MSALIALALITCPQNAPAPVLPKVGVARHYYPHRMEATARYRGLTLPPGYAGFASVQECDYRGRKDAMIGRTVHANIAGTGWRSYLVADCSHPRDRDRHKRSKLVIEIGYQQAKDQGWAGDRQRPALVLGYER